MTAPPGINLANLSGKGSSLVRKNKSFGIRGIRMSDKSEPIMGSKLQAKANEALASLADNLEKTDVLDKPGLSPVGDILVRKGHVRRYQIEFLLDLQEAYRKANRRIKMGQLLTGHRVVTKDQLDEALGIQDKLPQETVTKLIGQFKGQLSHITRLLSGR